MKSQSVQAQVNKVRLSVALTSAIVLSGLFASQSIANDVQVAAANCVAPYLDQAFPMRKHENYLMNPVGNVPTWVICPMDLDADGIPATFSTFLAGGIMAGASGELPTCFFTVNSAANLLQPPFIYGTAAKYQLSMPVAKHTTIPGLWYGSAPVVSANDIASALGIDRKYWAATIFCKLPPGYSISQLSITNN